MSDNELRALAALLRSLADMADELVGDNDTPTTECPRCGLEIVTHDESATAIVGVDGGES